MKRCARNRIVSALISPMILSHFMAQIAQRRELEPASMEICLPQAVRKFSTVGKRIYSDCHSVNNFCGPGKAVLRSRRDRNGVLPS